MPVIDTIKDISLRENVDICTACNASSIKGRTSYYPRRWDFTGLLKKYKDGDVFISKCAEVLYYTIPAYGLLDHSPLRLEKDEDYMMCTAARLGQYTMDLFIDDATANAIAEWPGRSDGAELSRLEENMKKILQYLKDTGYESISGNAIDYLLKGEGLPNHPEMDMIKKLGIMDNDYRNKKQHQWCLNDIGKSFMHFFDDTYWTVPVIKDSSNLRMSPKFELCKLLVTQALDDITDGKITLYMDITKTGKARSRTKAARSYTPKPAPDIWLGRTEIEDEIEEPEEEIKDEIDSIVLHEETVGEAIEESIETSEVDSFAEDDFTPAKPEEKEVKEKVVRLINNEKQEEISYSPISAPKPAIDPLALARDATEPVPEDDLSELIKTASSFLIKHKDRLTVTQKTALKELISAMLDI